METPKVIWHVPGDGTVILGLSEYKPKSIGRYSRLYLLILSEVDLVLGGVLFVHPSLIITLWPWPIKELAVQFFGAIFLAIAFGCWSALRAKGWQRGKILPLVGGVFFGITAIITASQIPSRGADLTIESWTLYFVIASAGLFIVILRHGWYRRPQDGITTGPILKRASFFFRIQTLVVGVFGTVMLFLPYVARQQFWPWQVATPTLQAFAGLFLATCLATGWAAIQSDKSRILALLPLDAVFPSMALLAVGLHWSIIAQESPNGLVTGVWVFLYSFVAAGSTYLFLSLRRSSRTR